MAKRFQFRLDVVRVLRKQARDQQRCAVAEAVGSVSRVERRIEQLTDELRETVEMSRGERRAERLDMPALRGQQFYRGWLHGTLLDSSTELSEKKAALDAERTKLGETTARLKAIEKLRERRWKRHVTQLRREGQAFDDEVAARIATQTMPRISGEGDA